jgi:Raf kinase inhibitor-like YbhB/YbcL family protein
VTLHLVGVLLLFITAGGPVFTLTSPSYKDKAAIPVTYAHRSVPGGHNVSPGFAWENPPLTTRSFALTIVDPHPVANNWVHWIVINIPFRERTLAEGASRSRSLPSGAKELYNSFSDLGYGGPAPPKGSGEHPYVATLYALNIASLDLSPNATLRQFLKAIEGKEIEESVLTGVFERR